MCHGGIWRSSTRSLIDFAQGRVSSHVTRDIGAMAPARWQFWHLSWKMGAISRANVTGVLSAGKAAAYVRNTRAAGFIIVINLLLRDAGVKAAYAAGCGDRKVTNSAKFRPNAG